MFSKDKVLIRSLSELKGYNDHQVIIEFANNRWKKCGINRLLQRLRNDGTVDRRSGSGGRLSACTDENVTVTSV